MKKMKKLLSVILSCSMALGMLTACSSSTESTESATTSTTTSTTTTAATETAEDEIIIRCGITVSQSSISAQALEVFNQSVQAATNGAIKLEVYYDGTMGDERDVLEGVSMGTIEMYAGSTAPIANFVDDFNILDLPYVVDMNDLDAAYALMDGEVGQTMLSSLNTIGVEGLALSHQGFRFMLNNDHEVATPEDAANLVIRTMENDIHLEFYKEVGANPVAMASTEAFTALAQGTIDGMDNIIDAFYTQGAFESAKYLTMTGHIISGYVFAINQDLFNSLTPDQQAAIKQASTEASIYLRDAAMAGIDEVAEIAQSEYGVTITEVDTQLWKEASAGVTENYKDSIDPVYWNAFYE